MSSQPNRRLTSEAIAASAAKYPSRVAWKRGDPDAYAAAKREGIFDEVCEHMPRTPRKHTLETLKASAAPYPNRYEWRKADPSAYLRAYQRGLLDEVCAHMTRKLRSSDYWSPETCKTSAEAYASRSAWQRGDFRAYYHARINGWLDQCCAHMSKPQRPLKWTPERIAASAQNFTSKRAWHRGEHGAYDAAKRLGLFEEVTAHMQHNTQPQAPDAQPTEIPGSDPD